MTAQQEQTENQPALAPEGRSLAWRIHPVKRKPMLSAVVTLAILLFSFLVFVSTESTFMTVLTMAILFV